MRVILPKWVAHEEGSAPVGIYTIDMHPDGTRFATGGSDSKVRIWGTAPVLHEGEVKPTDQPSQKHNHHGMPIPSQTSQSCISVAAAAAIARNEKALATKELAEEVGGKVEDLSSIPSPDGASEDFSTTNHSTSGPLRLAVLSNHQGGVNIVRWSTSGHLLASGSDDTSVILWKQVAPVTRSVNSSSNSASSKSRAIFSGSGSADKNFETVETWSRAHILRGHSMDVHDVAWAPDDTLLASCSIDNNVLIWRLPVQGGMNGDGINGGVNVILGPERRLSGHSSWVKGLAWDPMGTFLASASDDRSVVVWRTSDWQVEKRVEEPFEKVTAHTLFLRPSWSADGSLLCVVNAVKSRKPVATILKRVAASQDLWKSSADLAGHTAPIAAARFNNTVFASKQHTPSSQGKEKKNTSTSLKCGVVALGGCDGLVSVWKTDTPRPICVLKQAFTDSITDMCWSQDGYSLLITSRDAQLICLTFTPQELGNALPASARKDIVRELYGCELGSMVEGGVHRRGGMSQANGQILPPMMNGAAFPSGTAQTSGRQNMCEDIRVASFRNKTKKRIQPTLTTANDAEKTTNQGSHGTKNTNAVTQSSATSAVSALPTATAPIAATTTTITASTTTEAANITNIARPLVQKSSIRKDGKKRIAPMLISSTSDASMPTTTGGGGMFQNSNTMSEDNNMSSSHKIARTSNSAFLNNAINPSAISNGSSLGALDDASSRLNSYNGISTASQVQPSQQLLPTHQPNTSENHQQQSQHLEQSPPSYKMLVTPQLNVTESKMVACQLNGAEEYSVECCPITGGHASTNQPQHKHQQYFNHMPLFDIVLRTSPSYMNSSNGNGGAAPVWRSLVHGIPTAVCGNCEVVVAGTSCGEVHVFDMKTGVRLLPALLTTGSGGISRAYIENVVSIGKENNATFENNSSGCGGILAVVTYDGEVTVWNLNTMIKVNPTSVNLKSLLVPAISDMKAMGGSEDFRDGTENRLLERLLIGRNTSDNTPRIVALIITIPNTLENNTQQTANSSSSSSSSTTTSSSSLSSFLPRCEAFGLHCGLGAWMRMIDMRFALSDFFSSPHIHDRQKLTEKRNGALHHHIVATRSNNEDQDIVSLLLNLPLDEESDNFMTQLHFKCLLQSSITNTAEASINPSRPFPNLSSNESSSSLLDGKIHSSLSKLIGLNSSTLLSLETFKSSKSSSPNRLETTTNTTTITNQDAETGAASGDLLIEQVSEDDSISLQKLGHSNFLHQMNSNISSLPLYIQQRITVAHIEERMSLFAAMNKRKDFLIWMKLYVGFLSSTCKGEPHSTSMVTNNESEIKLRWLCDLLLGDVRSQSRNTVTTTTRNAAAAAAPLTNNENGVDENRMTDSDDGMVNIPPSYQIKRSLHQEGSNQGIRGHPQQTWWDQNSITLFGNHQNKESPKNEGGGVGFLDKRLVLEKLVLPVMSNHQNAHRLFIEYLESLEAVQAIEREEIESGK